MKGGKRALAIVGGIGIVLGALLTLFTINLAGNTLVPAGLISPHYRGTAPEEMTEEMIERLTSEVDKEKRPYMARALVKWMDSNDFPGVMDEMLEHMAFPEALTTWSSMEHRLDRMMAGMQQDFQGMDQGLQALRERMDKEFADAEKTMDCSVKTFDQNKGMVKVCVPKESAK